MTEQDYVSKYSQLIEDGFCLLEGVLDSANLEELRAFTDRKTDEMSADDVRAQKSTGSMLPVLNHEFFARLVAYRPALDALEKLGFYDTKFSSGYVISKPPGSPRLFWHFDWAGWTHPFSFEKQPTQIFLMYYLVDTNRENGCLRVIPRSHIEFNPLHSELAPAHTPEMRAARDMSLPDFQIRPDEVDVPVKAGDLVIGDSRILHATHANESDQRRTVITLWYHPDFRDLPEPIQGYIGRPRKDLGEWCPEIADELRALQPIYEGDGEPLEFRRVQLTREAFEERCAEV